MAGESRGALVTPSPNLSYDVRIQAIQPYKGKRRTTYRIKWEVAGRRFQRTLVTRKLAEAFRAELQMATSAGTPFARDTGLPRAPRFDSSMSRAWIDHAMEYVDAKWPNASPRHRRGIAEALTDATEVLLRDAPNPPLPDDLRRLLYRWAFNAAARQSGPPDRDLEAVLRWLERRSPPLGALQQTTTLRSVLNRYATRRDGTTAAAATIARKRATLHNVLQFAVELDHFATNPLSRVGWRAPRSSDVVDPRVVVNPAQARGLLDAVWKQTPALAGYFACIYYAALRPGEARHLQLAHCVLPEEGWGTLLLEGSQQTSGSAWTDDNAPDEARGLKHRSRADTRSVPAHPELVAILRRHLKTFSTGVNGHLFVTRVGRAGIPVTPPYEKPVPLGTTYRVWHRARATALTPAEESSKLARRPYDLRHACVSTWLNAGVPPARAAAWAGHSVEVLLRVYAKCVAGDDLLALRRIESAMEES
jgi:hypothetical protein